MSDYAIRRLAASLSEFVEARLAQRFDELEGTPIERLFETALFTVTGSIRFLGTPHRLWEADPALPLSDMPIERSKYTVGDVYYWKQYPILDWKVDFVIGTAGPDGKPYYVVVECDGHDFHERTKEQAAKDRSRDRRLQDAGYRILRYTGHEIYQDPFECAASALASLVKQFMPDIADDGGDV